MIDATLKQVQDAFGAGVTVEPLSPTKASLSANGKTYNLKWPASPAEMQKARDYLAHDEPDKPRRGRPRKVIDDASA